MTSKNFEKPGIRVMMMAADSEMPKITFYRQDCQKFTVVVSTPDDPRSRIKYTLGAIVKSVMEFHD